MRAKQIGPKKCKHCGEYFTPSRPMQVACSPMCALAVAKAKGKKDAEKKAREERRNDRAKREQLKTRRDWLQIAQRSFNAFIRYRDKDKPCICCGRPLSADSVGGGFDAGHYRSVGSAPHLRFDENNCHGQTKQCNRYGAGRAVDYRIGLIRRIGLEAVEALEADQSVKKWTIDELREIDRLYRAKLKSLLRGD